MKKLLLVLMGSVMVAGSTMAQNYVTVAESAMAENYEKNLFGIRAGLNVSNVSSPIFTANSRAGFHVAGVYQRLLTKTIPIYFETGLQITQKGCKIDSDKVNAMYIEIPVMVNYKFNIGDIVTIYPSAGLFYAYGISGKYKSLDFDGYEEAYYTSNEKLFGGDNYLKRSDIGLRISATVDWTRYSFGLGYEFGLLDIAKDEAFGLHGGVKSGNFFITVGYNF